jgi:hypothetical protein
MQIIVPSVMVIPTVSNITATSALVTWQTPTTGLNGNITSFVVSVTKTSDVHVPAEISSIDLSLLEPFSTYTVSVVVCNTVGCSSPRNNTFSTLESGNYCAL